MRSEDERRIGNAYDAAPKDHAPDRKFRSAMGVDAYDWHCLYVELRLDLAKGPPGGFHWWPADPALSHARRVLIADHLFAAVQDVHNSLIEARFHLLELHHAHDQETRRQRGSKATPLLPHEHAEDHLPRLAANVHAKGLVRALGSAFDCVAASVVGILALPWKKFLKADMPMVLEKQNWPAGDGDIDVFQKDVLTQIQTIIDTAGPTGWHRWCSDLRNTFVHRPSRVEHSSLHTSPLLDADGDDVIADVVHRMPREPALSDVQMFMAEPHRPPVLAEPAGRTMEHLVDVTMKAIDDIGRVLRVVWALRKERPQWLRQSATQWLDEALPKPTGFDGFAAGSAPYAPDSVEYNQPIRERLVAACLLPPSPPPITGSTTLVEGSTSGSGAPPTARPADARATPTATGQNTIITHEEATRQASANPPDVALAPDSNRPNTTTAVARSRSEEERP